MISQAPPTPIFWRNHLIVALAGAAPSYAWSFIKTNYIEPIAGFIRPVEAWDYT
jgi:hypothetical protein